VLSAAGVRILPGVGHFAPLEAPDAVAEAIRERM
jgi:pimeloyl-ACP methyl ester carboxylesterase